MATVHREKRRNSEKRKEKSRNAARSRRGKETEIFYELAHTLPLAHNACAQLDKAGIMRLILSYLKVSKVLPKEIKVEEKEESKTMAIEEIIDSHYQKALDGFLLVLSQEGDMIYISENVSKHIGINQVDLMGQSIYDYAHPCDHDEIREQLSDRPGLTLTTLPSATSKRKHHGFLMRVKCTLTPKGKIVNLKAASYKAVHCQGHMKLALSDTSVLGYRMPPTPCLVLIASPIPHPSNIEVPLDCSAFLTRHSMDMKFTYCDERIEQLMGYIPNELVGQSFYVYYHALDGQLIDKSYKDLYAKGQTSTGRYRFLAKNGGYMWLETQATIIYNNKTNKPQCIVCVNYAISGVEHGDRVRSVGQQEKEKEETRDAEMNEEKTFTPPRHANITNDFPLYLAGCNSSQAVEEKLAYLAPTAGDVMIELDPSDSQRMDLTSEFKEFSESDSFVPFDPFAPLPPSQAKESVPQSNNETVMNVQDPGVLKTQYLCTNNDPLLHEKRPNLDTEKLPTNDMVAKQQIPCDELAMRAPYIPMGEDFDLSTDPLLGDMDPFTSETWMPVDPFGTGSIDKNLRQMEDNGMEYSASQSSSCRTSPFNPSPMSSGSPMESCNSSLSGSVPNLYFPNSSPSTPHHNPLLLSPAMSPHSCAPTPMLHSPMNPNLLSPLGQAPHQDDRLFASPLPSPAPIQQPLGVYIPYPPMSSYQQVSPCPQSIMSPPQQRCQTNLHSPTLKRKLEPPDCGDCPPRSKISRSDGLLGMLGMRNGRGGDDDRVTYVKREPDPELDRSVTGESPYIDTGTQGCQQQQQQQQQRDNSMDLLSALLHKVDKDNVNPFRHSQLLQIVAQRVSGNGPSKTGNTPLHASTASLPTSIMTQGQAEAPPSQGRKSSITQLLGRDVMPLGAVLPLITNLDAEVNAPLPNTNRLLQGEDLLQALDLTAPY
nr:hypoxia-inducible factor 1a [Strongylocentrotus intermedius]